MKLWCIHELQDIWKRFFCIFEVHTWASIGIFPHGGFTRDPYGNGNIFIVYQSLENNSFHRQTNFGLNLWSCQILILTMINVPQNYILFFHFFYYGLLSQSITVKNGSKFLWNPNFWKARIFECTKFMYLDLITDMPNIDSEISQPMGSFTNHMDKIRWVGT